jgi:hypothetical protein
MATILGADSKQVAIMVKALRIFLAVFVISLARPTSAIPPYGEPIGDLPVFSIGRGLKRISYHTNNETPLLEPTLKSGRVVYSAQRLEVAEPPEDDNEIFYYPFGGGRYATQITDNDYHDGGRTWPETLFEGSPQLNEAGVAAWDSPQGVRVFWGLGIDRPRDGAPGRVRVEEPVISENNVLWIESLDDGLGGERQQYFVYNVASETTYEPSIFRLPEFVTHQYAISGDHVFEISAYHAAADPVDRDRDVYRWSLSGGVATQITPADGDYDEWGLTVWGDQAAWLTGHDGTTPEVYMYDGTTVRQITDNSRNESSLQIANGKLVWVKWISPGTADVSSQVMYFDGTEVHNMGEGRYSVISEQGVAWVPTDGGVVYYDIATGTMERIANAGVNARALSIDGSAIAFYADNALGEPGHIRSIGSGDYDVESFEGEVYLSASLGGMFAMAYSDLTSTLLGGVDLRNLDLQETVFEGNDLEGTLLAGANLTGASGLETTSGAAIYSNHTLLPQGFDPVAAGWSYVIPEPSALLLALVGLALAARRQSNQRRRR